MLTFGADLGIGLSEIAKNNGFKYSHFNESMDRIKNLAPNQRIDFVKVPEYTYLFLNGKLMRNQPIFSPEMDCFVSHLADKLEQEVLEFPQRRVTDEEILTKNPTAKRNLSELKKLGYLNLLITKNYQFNSREDMKQALIELGIPPNNFPEKKTIVQRLLSIFKKNEKE